MPNPILSSSEVYDPSTELWQSGPGLDAPRGLPEIQMLALPSGDLCVIGGPPSKPLVKWDGGDCWIGDPMPTPRSIGFTASCLVDGTIVVVGGQVDGTGAFSDAVEALDPATGEWKALPALAFPRNRAAATALADGSLLILGGEKRVSDARDDPARPNRPYQFVQGVSVRSMPH